MGLKDLKRNRNIGLNLGPKTTQEMASIGIETIGQLRKEGWKSAFLRLIEKYPERLNLNMATGLIGAVLDTHWQDVSSKDKTEAKELIRSLKPKKASRHTKSGPSKLDQSFVDFVVQDQLGTLNVDARRMFGGHGLYIRGKFFGIIYDGCLYLKTSEQTRLKYLDEQMKPFSPNPRQTLKSYYQVPIHILENGEELETWVQDAVRVAAQS